MNSNFNVNINNNGNCHSYECWHSLESTTIGSKLSQGFFCNARRLSPPFTSPFPQVTVTDHTQSRTLQESTENIIPLDETSKEELPSIQSQPSLISNTVKDDRIRANLPINKAVQRSLQGAFHIPRNYIKKESCTSDPQPLSRDQKFEEFVKILSDNPEETSEQIKIRLAQKWDVQFSSIKRYSGVFFERSKTDCSMVPFLNDFVNRCVLRIQNRYHRNYPHLKDMADPLPTFIFTNDSAKGTFVRLKEIEAFSDDFQTILRENPGMSARDVEILLAQKNWSPTTISIRIRKLMERASEDESLIPILEQYLSGCMTIRKKWYLKKYPYLGKTDKSMATTMDFTG